jgi:hypothetical protein
MQREKRGWSQDLLAQASSSPLKKRSFESRRESRAATMFGRGRENHAKEGLEKADCLPKHDPDGDLKPRKEAGERGIRRLPRRSVTEERPHHESKIERGDVGDVTLADVVASAQSHAAMRACLARKGEGSLDQLAA